MPNTSKSEENKEVTVNTGLFANNNSKTDSASKTSILGKLNDMAA
jgi:hypothetical protein